MILGLVEPKITLYIAGMIEFEKVKKEIVAFLLERSTTSKKFTGSIYLISARFSVMTINNNKV